MEIDAFEFTRSGRSAEGQVSFARLERLASLLAEPEGDLAWRLDGWRERDASGEERLRFRLRVGGSVTLHCGRCLGVARLPLAIDRGFLLAPSEAEAEKLDRDDEELDVLVASRKFALESLIEDEAILALPPAASHADCSRPPSGLTQESVNDAPAAPRRPFAFLASLKGKPPT